MKPNKIVCLVALLLIALSSSLSAEAQEYPQISLSWPGAKAPTLQRNEVLLLVIDGAVLYHEGQPVPTNGTVEYVDSLLTASKASYIGVYTRRGTAFGDVIKVIDALRGTKAKNIGLSMVELHPGQEP